MFLTSIYVFSLVFLLEWPTVLVACLSSVPTGTTADVLAVGMISGGTEGLLWDSGSQNVL